MQLALTPKSVAIAPRVDISVADAAAVGVDDNQLKVFPFGENIAPTPQSEGCEECMSSCGSLVYAQ